MTESNELLDVLITVNTQIALRKGIVTIGVSVAIFAFITFMVRAIVALDANEPLPSVILGGMIVIFLIAVFSAVFCAEQWDSLEIKRDFIMHKLEAIDPKLEAENQKKIDRRDEHMKKIY